MVQGSRVQSVGVGIWVLGVEVTDRGKGAEWWVKNIAIFNDLCPPTESGPSQGRAAESKLPARGNDGAEVVLRKV